MVQPRVGLISLVFLASSLFSLSAARAEVNVVELSLIVSDDSREVSGTMRATVVNDSERTLSSLPLWLPFNRLSRPPEGMDQRNAHWIYPRAFTPGTTELVALHLGDEPIERRAAAMMEVDGLEQDEAHPVLLSLELRSPLAPGESRNLEVEFVTRVPRRFGRLGRANGVLTLAGGLAPRVATMVAGEWQLDGPYGLVEWRVDVDVPAESQVIANGQRLSAGPEREVLHFRPSTAPYFALVVSRRFQVSRVELDGVTIELLSAERRYRRPRRERGFRDPLAPGDVGDAMRWDWQGRILGTARRTLEVLEEQGYAPRDGDVVRLIEVPLRLEMVSPIPGGALISDRTYRITPLEQFFRFHDLQVARAVAWIALDEAVGHESRADRAWARDLLAAAVADAFAVSSHGGRGPGLRRLVRVGAFIPEIDQLLYSPIIEFRHLFLRPFRDEDPVRDEPWRLASSFPRGSVLHDKLVDLIGDDAVQRLLRRYLDGEAAIRALVADVAGEDMEWFFQQWLGPYPSVAYRLGARESQELEDGRYRHRVIVERLGADIREPVEVRLHLQGGAREDLRWDGHGARTELVCETERPLVRVEIDPRRRLIEDPALTGDNPRFDNIDPPLWRPPVLNGLMFYVSAAEAQLYALIDFSLRRQYDARNGLRFRLEYEPRGVRGDLFYQHGFGPLLHLDRASWVLSAGVNLLRTREEFGVEEGENVSGATAFGASVTLSHDTRWYRYDPMEGWGVSLSVFGSGSASDEGDWGWTLGTSGRLAGHWTPRVGHTFTGYFGAGVVFGTPLDQQLQSISDRTMLRAFEADETLGRARLYAGVEYRWTLLHDMNINLFHIAWWRAIFLAAFVAGGTVSNRDGLDGLFSKDRLFSEVGGGVRLLLDIAGVLPYIIAVDLAYPLTPTERQGRIPFGLYVSIQHTM